MESVREYLLLLAFLAKLCTYHSIVWFPIEEENFAVVPSSVGVLNLGQNETGETILATWPYFGDSAFVVLRCMFGIVIIPNIKRNFRPLVV